MTHLMTRFRGLMVAIVALAISAGAAFAWGGPPEATTDGLATAAAAAGKTVPARAEEAPNAGGDEDAAEDGDEADAPSADEPADETATDNHGSLVSQAAQMDTPTAFTDEGLNHGAFVSCVARMNHGHEDPDAAPSEPVDLATLTPEDCGITTEATATATKNSKAPKAPKANGKSKDHSTHGKAAKAPGHSR